MDELPKSGDRVRVPFGLEGMLYDGIVEYATRHWEGGVVRVWIRLDGGEGPWSDHLYPLCDVEPAEEPVQARAS
jgi:hypothetical protein